MSSLTNRISMVEDTVGMFMPRIGSVENELKNVRFKLSTLEQRLDRQLQRERMQEDDSESVAPSQQAAATTATPMAVVSHRGVGSTLPLPPPAPAGGIRSSPPASVSVPQATGDHDPEEFIISTQPGSMQLAVSRALEEPGSL